MGRYDRRTLDPTSVADALASGLRGPRRMPIRHVDSHSQLLFGERLIVHVDTFRSVLIRLPEWDSVYAGVVSQVVVYGQGYVQLVPPLYMNINDRSASVFVTSWNPATLILDMPTTWACSQPGYQTTWSQWNHADKSVTTAGSLIFATKNPSSFI